jgi:xylan 1,4-beta-xylosidase
VKKPFYGGYGLIASGRIPKAAFNAFAMLHGLGDQRLSPELKDALVTKRDDGTLVIAVWNYAEPGAGGEPRDFELHLTQGQAADVTTLDEQHGSAFTAWKTMGEPAFPSREQQQALRAAAMLPSPVRMPIQDHTLRLNLAPHGLALIEVAHR